MRILLLCTGNTCRSPMAEALLRAALAEVGRTDITVVSAGTAALPGLPAAPQAVAVLKERGIHADAHRSSALAGETMDGADLILTMTERHKDQVLRTFPAAAGKVHTLGEYIGNQDLQVADPYGYEVDVYRRTAAQIDAAMRQVVQRLQREAGAMPPREQE